MRRLPRAWVGRKSRGPVSSSRVGRTPVHNSFEVAMIRAYHRHMADFCGQFPTRLKGLIVASTHNVEDAVREIRAWGNSTWAVAVKPLLPRDVPADHPELEPIWRAAQD